MMNMSPVWTGAYSPVILLRRGFRLTAPLGSIPFGDLGALAHSVLRCPVFSWFLDISLIKKTSCNRLKSLPWGAGLSSGRSIRCEGSLT